MSNKKWKLKVDLRENEDEEDEILEGSVVAAGPVAGQGTWTSKDRNIWNHATMSLVRFKQLLTDIRFDHFHTRAYWFGLIRYPR